MIDLEILDIVEPFLGIVGNDENGLIVPCSICADQARFFRLYDEMVTAYCEEHAPSTGDIFHLAEATCLMVLKSGRQIRRAQRGSVSGLMWSRPDGVFTPAQDAAWYHLTGQPANRFEGRYR